MPAAKTSRGDSFAAADGAWKLVGVQRGLDVGASGGVRVAICEDVERALGANAGEGQGMGGVGRHLNETETRG